MSENTGQNRPAGALDPALEQDLMDYCAIDEADMDDRGRLQLAGFYHSAVSYMEAAGVEEPNRGDDEALWFKWMLCIKHLVLDAWDHRGAQETASSHENPAFRRLVNQLKLSNL